MIKKTDMESPLIFVLFLKGKQNKKETKWLITLENVVCEKPDRFGGQITYQEGMVKTVAPL